MTANLPSERRDALHPDNFYRYERLDQRMEARLACRTQEGIAFFLGLAFETPIDSGLFYKRYLAPSQQ